MPSNFRLQLEDWLKGLSVKAEKVLDVGGLQYPLGRARLSSWDVGEYKILDVVEEMDGRKADYVADIARPLNYHNDIQELEDEWDAVFCLEVMEYVINPVQAMTNLYSFLKPGGTAYISFPFVYPSHPPLGTDFLRYTQDGVEALLRETGFKEYDIVVRRASVGKQLLKDFYSNEGMKFRRDDMTFLDHIGYIATAKKPDRV